MNNKQPNILLITTDQQRYDTIREAGYPHMQTPNLDRLAQEGCLYPNAYSCNPVCMSARHNILTGLPARYHGFDDNYFDEQAKPIPYDLATFPQLLSDQGYDTIGVGKMHFQPCRRHNGFQKLELMEEIPRYREDDEYATYLKEQGYGRIQSIHGVRHLLYMLPQRSLLPKEHHGSTWVADRSIHHLKENAGKRPFLLWSSFIAPHPPFDVPDEWANLYRGKELPPLKRTQTPLSELAEENKSIADYPDEIYQRRARELYYASISFADYQIGRILGQLKEMGEYDNTLILFTSDHGEMLGDYQTYQKFLPYDSSAKIPFIIRYPLRIPAHSIDGRFVDLNDILPTILDAAGITHPREEMLPGESVLIKNGQKERDLQYMEHGGGSKRWVSLVDQNYKYNYYYGGGKEELFDRVKDPEESNNLLYQPDPHIMEHISMNNAAKDIEYPIEIAARMRRELVEIEETQGLEGYVEAGDFLKLPPYQNKHYRENNPPVFPAQSAEGIESYLFVEEEVALAVREEKIVQVKDLDLSYFITRGTIKEGYL